MRVQQVGMAEIEILIPAPLRAFTAGVAVVSVRASRVGDALAALIERHPGLGARLLDPEGRLRRYVNLFVDGSNVRDLQGLDTALSGSPTLAIIPAVAGGSGLARERRLAELRYGIAELDVRAARRQQAEGAVLIDVREPGEWTAGTPEGALCLSRGYLELQIEDHVPDVDRAVLLLCGGGARSLFAAEDLQRLGYSRVSSVAGGFNAWKDAGLPVTLPRLLDAEARERYARHLLMPEVGEAGQWKLADARVVLIGAGGLGSPAALYLAAAGVGTLGIVDHDVVDRSNLQRQILHADARVGMPKVDSARVALHALNPTVQVETHRLRLDQANAAEVLAGYQVVVDGSDNFAARYAVNDACVQLGIPNVQAAVFRFDGQLMVSWPAHPGRPGPCYRCIYPEPPPAELAPSCAEAGVLGVLPGLLGLLQATEVIKLLLGIGEPLVGRLLHVDALRPRFMELRVNPDPDCPVCAPGRR
jgi:sulfur-carrier protein adenylyltransferase/sulfurtransferase